NSRKMSGSRYGRNCREISRATAVRASATTLPYNGDRSSRIMRARTSVSRYYSPTRGLPSGQPLQNGAREILLADGPVAGERPPAFHQGVDQRIVQRPYHHVHGRGHERVREGAQLPVAEMRGGHQHAAAGLLRLVEMLAPFEADPLLQISPPDGRELGEGDQNPGDGAEYSIDDLGMALRRELGQRHGQIASRHPPQPRNSKVEQTGVDARQSERQF